MKRSQRYYPSTDDGHGRVQGDPPSVIRNGWCRKMGLVIRGRTDRYGDPKTDRVTVEEYPSSVVYYKSRKRELKTRSTEVLSVDG